MVEIGRDEDAGVEAGDTGAGQRLADPLVLNARFLAIASTMGTGLSEADIRRAAEIVRQLSDDAKGRSERLP